MCSVVDKGAVTGAFPSCAAFVCNQEEEAARDSLLVEMEFVMMKIRDAALLRCASL